VAHGHPPPDHNDTARLRPKHVGRREEPWGRAWPRWVTLKFRQEAEKPWILHEANYTRGPWGGKSTRQKGGQEKCDLEQKRKGTGSAVQEKKPQRRRKGNRRDKNRSKNQENAKTSEPLKRVARPVQSRRARVRFGSKGPLSVGGARETKTKFSFKLRISNNQQ